MGDKELRTLRLEREEILRQDVHVARARAARTVICSVIVHIILT